MSASSAAHEDNGQGGSGGGVGEGADAGEKKTRKLRPSPASAAAAAAAAEPGRQQVRIRRHRGKEGGGWGGDGDGDGRDSGMNLADQEREAEAVQVRRGRCLSGLGGCWMELAVGFGGFGCASSEIGSVWWFWRQAVGLATTGLRGIRVIHAGGRAGVVAVLLPVASKWRTTAPVGHREWKVTRQHTIVIDDCHDDDDQSLKDPSYSAAPFPAGAHLRSIETPAPLL